jgi:type I restriction enzyme S subunit
MEVKPGYKLTEVGLIPEDWDVSTVGEEFEIKLGKMLDAERNVGIPKPYLGNKSVQWGRIDVNDLPTVPMSPADIESFRLRKGDLLVCEGGEVGRAALWTAPIGECYYQKALHRLRPTRGFESRLMVALLRQWSDRGRLANYVTQTSIAHLPREKFLEVPIPLPPPCEQRDIAALLDDVDALLGALERLIAKKHDLKQAVMQQLLTGKTRLPGFSGEWDVRRLEDCGLFLKGRGIRKDEVVAEGLPCIRYGEIYTHHHDHVRAFNSFITQETAQESQRIEKGDLLFAGSGETAEEIGKCVALLWGVEAYAGGDIVILRPRGQSSEYLGYLMNHSSVVDQKARMGQGDAVVHISARSLARLELLLPCLPEQIAIARVLTDMDAELAALEQRLTKTRDIKQGMMQELLTGKTRLISPQEAHA